MRKTIRNGIGRRAVYKFKCSGPCNKIKHTYVYERAKKGLCLSCSKNGVDSNQASLFEPNQDQINLMDELMDEKITAIKANPFYSKQTKKDFIERLKIHATT